MTGLFNVQFSVNLGVHKQHAVTFRRRQFDQSVALLVDFAELRRLADTEQAALVVIGPGMEGAGEARLLTAGFLGQQRAAVTAGVHKRMENTVLVARREDRNTKIPRRDETAGGR